MIELMFPLGNIIKGCSATQYGSNSVFTVFESTYITEKG